MSFKIIWSKFSETQLDAIHKFYSLKANPEIADRIVYKIVNEVSILENDPLLGPREPLLLERTNKYRYIICNSYKIIYSVDEANNLIKIADVFDSRQNPKKLNRNK